jgi:predicted TIM-barrel fold metal-dependent hydrolase
VFNGAKVLDIHAHVSAPSNGTQALALMLAGNTPIKADPRTMELAPLGMTAEGWAVSNQRHLALLDDQQIDCQLLGPRPFLMLGWMQPHLLPAWTRFVNNMIAKQVSLTPSRFVGAAQLPQNPDATDLSDCIPELDRCVHELGFKGVYLSPDPSGDRRSPGMDQPYWHPVYKRCEELGLPIIVHGTNCCDPRIAPIPANYQIGFVWEQYLATQLLLHGDVFERFPKLKVVICHCGGALDRFIPEDREHMAQNLRIGNLYFDTNALDLHFLEAAIKQRTPARMCFGTEVPGSGRATRKSTGRPGDDLVPIIGGFDFLTDDDKRTIFNSNPSVVCPALGEL